MKNKKSLRILIAALAFAILAVALCFAAFAEDTPELSVKILAKNVAYDDVVKVLFAVDDTAAGGNEVEVIYYVEDPSVNTQAKAYAGIEYEVGYTDKNGTPDDTSDDVKYPAFFTAGFPAANIGDNVYARAHIVGTDVYSDVVRYSVVEYLLERLYVDEAQGDKKALYETLLDYGEYSQKVILNGDADPDNDVERFVTEYVLVTMSEGGIDETPDNKRDNSYPTGIYFPGDKIYPTSKEVKSWKVTVGDSSTVVNNAAEVTVSGFTTITVNEYANATPAYKPDLTDTEGRETFEGGEEVVNADPYAPDGGKAEIVDGTPYGEDSKVYYLGSNNKNTQEVSFRVSEKDADANVIWFESDMMILPYSTGNVEVHIRSKTNVGYKFYLALDPDGNVILKDENTTDIATLAPAGEWFRFGFKYATQDDGKAALAFYYNEERVASTVALEGDFTVEQLVADTVTPRIRVRFMSWTATACDHYFDNIKLDVIKSDDYAITVEPGEVDPDQPGEGGEGGEDGPTVPTNPVDPTYKPDLTDTAGRETYDDNNLTDVFTQYDLWIDGAAAGSKIEIADGKPYGTDSKVYYYHTVAGFKPEINMKFNVVSGANAARFETDLMLDPDVADNIQFIFGSGSAGVNCFWFESTEEGDIYLLAKNESRIAKVAVAGEWFRLTVEYLEYEDGTRAFKFYVNEKRVGEGRVFAGDQAISQFQKFRVWSEPEYVGDIYFDNTKVEFYTHTEEPEVPTIPEEPEELDPIHPDYAPDLEDVTGRETYEEGDALDTFQWNNWIDGEANGALWAIEDGEPYGVASKVYHYKTVSGHKPEVTFQLIAANADATAYGYETDMMLTGASYNRPQFQIRTNDNKLLFTYHIERAADGYVNLLDGDCNKIATIAIDGEWFRLRVEVIDYADGIAIVRFYVDGERVGADKLFTITGTANTVGRMRFWTEETHLGDIYFDNTKIDFVAVGQATGPLNPDYAPTLDDLTSRETYEDGDTLDLFKFNNWHDNQGEGAYVIENGKTYGVDSKVYHYTTLEGFKPEVTFQLLAQNEAATVYAYETDMMFSGLTYNRPQFQIRNSSNAELFKFHISITEYGYVKLLDADNKEIATIATEGEWFRLRVEYIDVTADVAHVRFYVNGERVGADRVFAASGLANTVQRFRFWTETSHLGDIYFDNTKIEYTATENYQPEYTPNLEDVTGRETYEDGDTLDTFKWNNWIDGEANGTLWVIEDGAPYGVASKVYHYKTVAGHKPEVTFQLNAANVDATAYAYETDMMLVGTDYNRPQFQIRTNDNNLLFTYHIERAADGKVNLLDGDTNKIATIAMDGEWFRLRVEVVDFNGGAVVRFYVNGERVGADKSFTITSTANTVGRMRFWTEENHLGHIYFDNTKIEFVACEQATGPLHPNYTPDLTDTTGRETYEDGDALDTFKWNNWHDNQGEGAYVIESGKPYGVDSKVYHYTTLAGYKPEVTFQLNSANTEATAYCYETDMMLTGATYNCPQFQIRTNDNKLVFTFHIERDEFGYVNFLDADKKKIAAIATDGEWFRFRLEYVDGTDGAEIKFYVNGERIAEDQTFTAANLANTIGRVRFWTETSHLGDIYFDNTKIDFTPAE